MKTKLSKQTQCSKLPAGIFSGVELFANKGKMYAMYNGTCISFDSLPNVYQQHFFNAFLQDKEAQCFFRTTGVLEKQFDHWLFCKFASLDAEPDLIDDKINPDSYNNVCLKQICPGRGKICCKKIGLKDYQVETLKELKTGKTMKEVAECLCVSEHTIKSRIENMKAMFNVTNVVALVATVVDLGL